MSIHKCTVQAYLIITFAFLLLNITCNPVKANDNYSRNNILIESLSPFEDLAEDAINRNSHGLQGDIAAAKTSFGIILMVISQESFKRLTQLLADIDISAKNHEYGLLSLQSLETYKVISMELNQAKLKMPIEVAMLDYTGFKIQALLSFQYPDWTSLDNAVTETTSYWSAIAPKISRKAVRDAFETDMRGLSQALETKNTAMLFFASQVDLDLVDLLEEYFG